MQAGGYRLGVDFGTSHTVAVLRWPDGRSKPLLFDGTPLLSSAVYLDSAGRFVVGRDALDSGRLDPGRLEPNPKRRIDDGSVLLGDREVEVVDLVAAVLATVGAEAVRTAGQRPAVVTLTCPATWGTPRRRVLLAAAARAGLGEVRMVEEPVAAATYFAHVLGHRMATGTALVVYDFGGGTFDVSLVERTGGGAQPEPDFGGGPHPPRLTGGFRTRAVDGRDDIGGLDLDQALIGRLGAVYGPQNPAAWRRLVEPVTVPDRRQWRLFRDDVRAVKERLSRYPTADLHLPGFDRDAHVTREEFEILARPLLDQTIEVTRRVAGQSGFARERIAGVFLVGGASRIPLVATLVHRGLGIAPTVIEQPELVVAEGSIVVQSVVAMTRDTGDAAAFRPAADGPTVALRSTPTLAPAGGGPATPITPATPATPATRTAPATPTARTTPAPPVTPTGPADAEDRPRAWSRPVVRWLAVAAGVAVVAAAVLVVTLLSNRSGGGSAAVPAACALATPATGTSPLPAGSLRPAAVQPPRNWTSYEDPSGFRFAFPTHWSRFGSGVCFGDKRDGQYGGVAQWRQPDSDLATYVALLENQVKAKLPGYRKLGIRPHPDYFPGATDWQFTFDDGSDRMRVLVVALQAPGQRGYAYFWATREQDWQKNLTDVSRLDAIFRPAG